MKAVIFAAGKGKRLWPITEPYPKPFVKILGKPLIGWIIESLKRNKVNEIIVIVNPKHTLPVDYYDFTKKEIDHSKTIPVNKFLEKVYDVKTVFQNEPKGTAHALWCAREYIDDDFILMNGDDVVHFEDMEKIVSEKGFFVSFFEDRSHFGAVVHENGLLVDIKEKTLSGPGLISLNLAHVPKEFIEYSNIEKMKLSERGEYEIADAFINFAKDNEFKIIEIKPCYTISFYWDLIKVSLSFIERFVNGKYPLEWLGKDYRIESDSIIHENAVVKTNELKGSFVGPGVTVETFSKVSQSVLEGFNRIGTSEIKGSVMMKKSNIPHFNYVGDSVLCEDVNLGAGTKLANLRFDNQNIFVETHKGKVNSKKHKLGSCIGAYTKFGVNSSVNCGLLIAPQSQILPNTFVKRNMGD